MFFHPLKSFFLTQHHAHPRHGLTAGPGGSLSWFVRHGEHFGQIVFQRIFNHTGWGLSPTIPDVTFNPSVMQSNSAILAQAQCSSSRRQCKSQMCVCKSFACHDHLHRSGRRHGNQAIQPEESAQFPRQWGPNRHKRQREPVDPDSAIQRTFPCNKVGSSNVAVAATHPGFLEADMQARSFFFF